MQAVTHPNLIKVFAHDSAEPPRWMVLEYHPGGTLEARAGDYLGNPLRVFQALIPVAEALGRLHDAGRFHRDVKPANIFIARDERLVLGDLGIVYDEDATRLTQGKDPPVSRDWIPPSGPEIEFDARWDLFMLTRVAMFLISGHKMKFNNWLKDPRFNLPVRFPDVFGIAEVQEFFRRHFVDSVDAFPSTTATDYLRDLRDLVRLLSGQRIASLVWSFSAPPPGHHADLAGFPILVPIHARRLTASGLAHTGTTVRLELATMDNTAVLAVSTESAADASGFLPILIAQPNEPLRPGWYRLSLAIRHTRPDQAFLYGMSVYAE